MGRTISCTLPCEPSDTSWLLAANSVLPVEGNPVRMTKRCGSTLVFWTVSIAAIFSCGCATLRFHEDVSRPPKQMPDTVLARYAYPKAGFEQVGRHQKKIGEHRGAWSSPFTYTERTASEKDSYVLKEIEIFAGATTVRFDYYMVRAKERTPVVIVFPILGGGYAIEKMFANHFARHGLSCAIMYRKKGFAEAKTFDQFEPPLHEIVTDTKIVIDWLCERNEIDPARIGAFGISLGGVKSAIVKCLDPRIGPAVVALAGGELADLLASSCEPAIVKRRGAVMRDERIDAKEFRYRADAAIVTDPLKLAQYADASEIRMFIALFDRTVPMRLQLRLWRALGRPQVSILPFSHYTAAMAVPYAMWQSQRFFETKFGMREAATRSAIPGTR